jgi:hypothetical protein
MENDILFHTDVYKLLSNTHKTSVMNIDKQLSVIETIQMFDYFFITVPMRFHACLFSIYKEVPMIPVFTTKKILNFLRDINWNQFYKLDTDSKDLPIQLDSQLLLSKISQLYLQPGKHYISDGIKHLIKAFSTDSDSREKNGGDSERTFSSFPERSEGQTTYITNKKILKFANLKFNKVLETTIQNVVDVVTLPFSKQTPQCGNKFIDILIERIVTKLKEYMHITDNNCISTHFQKVNDIHTRNIIVSIVSYFLTNGLDSKYNHGLMQKMFDNENLFDYKKEWTWIIKDIKINGNNHKICSYHNGILNMNFVDQNDYSESHRSGWQFIINNIKTLNNGNQKLLFDLSIDKTFHWKEDINKTLNIIPYTQSWFGVIHHTFDESFSKYNNMELLRKQSFISSLKFCKGLLVFSNHLKNRFILEFSKFNTDIHIPPIFVLCHPTELVSNNSLFTWDKFMSNHDKKILHVGGWLRNIFSFYNLKIPKKYSFLIKKGCSSYIKKVSWQIRKVALKGHNMENYFPETCTDISIPVENDKPLKNCSLNTTHCNNWYEHMHEFKNCSQNDFHANNWYKHNFEYIQSISSSVDIINRVSNDQYDLLLQQNIIFLHLVDASTVNTILECIVRNTPIIVNKIDPVVELLGLEYPLYFDSSLDTNISEQVTAILSDTKNIKSAHKYLTTMDKRRFTIEFFMNDLKKIVKTLHGNI